MTVDLNIKVKGYYIKLLLIAENNKILLTPNKLADKLGIDVYKRQSSKH